MLPLLADKWYSGVFLRKSSSALRSLWPNCFCLACQTSAALLPWCQPRDDLAPPSLSCILQPFTKFFWLYLQNCFTSVHLFPAQLCILLASVTLTRCVRCLRLPLQRPRNWAAEWPAEKSIYCEVGLKDLSIRSTGPCSRLGPAGKSFHGLLLVFKLCQLVLGIAWLAAAWIQSGPRWSGGIRPNVFLSSRGLFFTRTLVVLDVTPIKTNYICSDSTHKQSHVLWGWGWELQHIWRKGRHISTHNMRLQVTALPTTSLVPFTFPKQSMRSS